MKIIVKEPVKLCISTRLGKDGILWWDVRTGKGAGATSHSVRQALYLLKVPEYIADRIIDKLSQEVAIQNKQFSF